MSEIGRVPAIFGARNIQKHTEPWYISMLQYSKIQELVGPVKAAPIWLVDDTATFDHPSIKDSLKEAWTFTGEDALNGSHGTHVAGIAACQKYGLFPKSITFGTAKVLRSDTGRGKMEWISSGILKGIEQGYEVFNFSIGGNHPDAGLKKAFKNLCGNSKRFAICASGNDDQTDYPAAWMDEMDGIISVGAIEKDGSFEVRVADYSSRGFVSVCMPGTDILSTVPNGRYEYVSGTSMAAMFVTALIAVAKGLNPDFDHKMCYDLMSKNAVKVPRASKEEAGVGYLNLYDFLNDVKTFKHAPKPKKFDFRRFFKLK